MKLIPKYQTPWSKMPLLLNDEGRKDWAAEHATELPEVIVTAPRPLTETERRWKRNLTDDEYRAQRDALHASLLNAIKGSTIMGQTLMGGENSALPYGFGIVDVATGVGALEDMARGITRSALSATRQKLAASKIGEPNNRVTEVVNYLEAHPESITRTTLAKDLDSQSKQFLKDSYQRWASENSIYNPKIMLEVEGTPVYYYNFPFNNGVQGMAGNNKIYINNLYTSALDHELNHLLRNKIGNYSSGRFAKWEIDLLDQAYLFTPDLLATDPLLEKGALNAEIRKYISKINKDVLGSDLDKYIDSLNMILLRAILRNIKTDYARSVLQNLSPSKIPYIKSALKRVGLYTGGSLIINLEKQ